MRISRILPAALFAICTAFGAHAMSGTLPGHTASSGSTEQPLLLQAKIKCSIDSDGDLTCTTKKKDEAGGGGGGNKCSGINNCGKGYRDLDRPNKYGACCEQIPVTSCNQGCKNHCTNTFVPGSQKWKSCVAGCGC